MTDNNGNNNQKIKLYERVAYLESCSKDIRDDIKELRDEFINFKDNHFHSFQVEMRTGIKRCEDKINSRPTWLLTGIVSILVALVVYLLTS